MSIFNSRSGLGTSDFVLEVLQKPPFHISRFGDDLGIVFWRFSEALGTAFLIFATLEALLKVDEFSACSLNLSRAGGEGDQGYLALLMSNFRLPNSSSRLDGFCKRNLHHPRSRVPLARRGHRITPMTRNQQQEHKHADNTVYMVIRPALNPGIMG